MPVRPYLDLLRRNRSFSRLFVAQLISFAGDWFATVAILGLTLELTGSPTMASLLLVVQTGAFAVASPIAGVLADRFDRRRLMVIADLSRVPVAFAFLFARDAGTLWIAFAAVGLLSVGAAVFEPTSSASLPNLVDDDDLGEANVLIGSAWGTMLAVGAAIGGLVAATFGRDVAFVANAASFAASGLLIIGITRPLKRHGHAGADHHQMPHSGLRGIGDSIGVVLRFARGNRRLAALLLSKTTFGVGTGVIVMLAIFGRDVFKAGDAGIGILFAARGLGALIGPFLARSTVGLTDRGLLLGIAGSFVTFAVGYVLLPLSPTLWVASICVFVAHLGGGSQWMLSSYGLQRASPDEIRGRVFSFDYGLVTITIAISMLIAGFLAERLEPAVTTWIMVGLAALAATGWLALARPLMSRSARANAAAVPERPSSD